MSHAEASVWVGKVNRVIPKLRRLYPPASVSELWRPLLEPNLEEISVARRGLPEFQDADEKD